jgi:large subunit ribosomal protein L13
MISLTWSTKSIREKDIKRDWHLIDVSGKILGRIAPEIAKFLIGKHKTNYVSYLDMGDYVVVVNAAKVKVTGRKDKQKVYTRYSGYPGGLRKMKYEDMMKKNPQEIIKKAVAGMLPKNKLRDRRIARLFIFAKETHSYQDKFELKK